MRIYNMLSITEVYLVKHKNLQVASMW